MAMCDVLSETVLPALKYNNFTLGRKYDILYLKSIFVRAIRIKTNVSMCIREIHMTLCNLALPSVCHYSLEK